MKGEAIKRRGKKNGQGRSDKCAARVIHEEVGGGRWEEGGGRRRGLSRQGWNFDGGRRGGDVEENNDNTKEEEGVGEEGNRTDSETGERQKRSRDYPTNAHCCETMTK